MDGSWRAGNNSAGFIKSAYQVGAWLPMTCWYQFGGLESRLSPQEREKRGAGAKRRFRLPCDPQATCYLKRFREGMKKCGLEIVEIADLLPNANLNNLNSRFLARYADKSGHNYA